jgi:DNA primase
MNDEVEEIKRRIDIADFISQYIPIKKAGANFKAVCPFHNEKTPSFMISPEKQIWHCFGCQKGGDIFGFLMEYENIEFVDALKQLAEKAGVKLTARNPQLKKTQDEIYQINLVAAKLFHHILNNEKIGKPVLDYLKNDRGLTQKTIDEFMIGYAPDSWNILTNFFKKRNYTRDDIIKSGLVIPKEDGTFYDRFRNRITFPISEISKNVVGFSARLFDKKNMATAGRNENPAKYINTPDSPIYNKSKILFALDKAKDEIRKTRQIIIVEGQMDVVMSHQSGFKNTIASSGTAITSDQLKILKRFSADLNFAFDADKAGEEATKRAIAVAHQAGMIPKIILTPAGLDPADVIKKDPKIFAEAIKNSKTAVDFYFDNEKEKYKGKTLTSSDKQKIANNLIPIIKEITEPILIGDYIRKLSKIINTDEKYLYEAYKKADKKFQNQNQPEKLEESIPNDGGNDSIERRVIYFALKYPKYINKIFAEVTLKDFENLSNLQIAKSLKNAYTKDGAFDEKKFRAELSDKEKKLVDEYYLEAENEVVDLKEEGIFEEVIISAKRLKSKRLEIIKQNLSEKISQAEASGNRQEIKLLIEKLQKEIGGANG